MNKKFVNERRGSRPSAESSLASRSRYAMVEETSGFTAIAVKASAAESADTESGA
jgi:hypothetical protein